MIEPRRIYRETPLNIVSMMILFQFIPLFLSTFSESNSMR